MVGWMLLVEVQKRAQHCAAACRTGRRAGQGRVKDQGAMGSEDC